MPDICASIDSTERAVRAAGWRRIGIDGVDPDGMSYLAQTLSQALGCPALDVDDYLYRNQGGYVDFIDYPALSAALAAMPAFVLSGACLREVLLNLAQDVDGQIYIKRMQEGSWADEDQCVFPEGVDAAIEELASNTAMISRYFDEPSEHAGFDGGEAAPHLTLELMHYHDAHRPHELADLVYERGEDGA
jgi:hypothetical protein